jgi:hypothetical protein
MGWAPVVDLMEGVGLLFSIMFTLALELIQPPIQEYCIRVGRM